MAIAQSEENSNKWCSTSEDPSLMRDVPNKSCDFADDGVANFARLSWYSFIALNWPGYQDEDGSVKPKETIIGQDPSAPRVWELYATPEQIFSPDSVIPKECDANSDVTELASYGIDGVLEMISKGDIETNIAPKILQTTNKPLVDQKHHYVIYEIRINPDEVNQIKDNHWYNPKNLEEYNDKNNRFEFKPNKNDGSLREPGPIELKISWLLLGIGTPDKPDYEDISGMGKTPPFYTTSRAIYVPPQNNSVTGKDGFCKPVKLGLLGFHIAHKLPAPNPDPYAPNPIIPLWVWSTFSHVDAKTYLYDNNYCPDGEYCKTNHLYAECKKSDGKCNYLWNPENLEAVKEDGQPQIPTQVLAKKPAKPDPLLKSVNEQFRDKLSGSVWENYQLIGTQWPTKPWQDSANYDDYYQQRPKPDKLANSSIETYNQDSSSCVACHANAQLPRKVNSATSDFSFIFQKAFQEVPIESDSANTLHDYNK